MYTHQYGMIILTFIPQGVNVHVTVGADLMVLLKCVETDVHVHVCMSSFFIIYQSNTTPLQIACYQGHHDIVQSLLGAGADVNTAISDVSNNFTHLWSDETKHLRE